MSSSPPSSPLMYGNHGGYPNGLFNPALYESSSSPLSSGPSSPDVSCGYGIPNLSLSQSPSAGFPYGLLDPTKHRPAPPFGYPLTQLDLYYLWMSVPQDLLPYPYQLVMPQMDLDAYSRQLACYSAGMPVPAD
jgi:hypothetical protein